MKKEVTRGVNNYAICKTCCRKKNKQRWYFSAKAGIKHFVDTGHDVHVCRYSWRFASEKLG